MHYIPTLRHVFATHDVALVDVGASADEEGAAESGVEDGGELHNDRFC